MFRSDLSFEFACSALPTLCHPVYPAVLVSPKSPIACISSLLWRALTTLDSISTPSRLVVMSRPLQERRSERNREPRRLFADEQAYHRFQLQADAEIQRQLREAAATVEPSDSDEEELPVDGDSSSEDESKVPPNDENIESWTEELHDVHPPICNALPTVVLPRHRPSNQLGYLQCFLDPGLIDTFVTSTNLYAISRGAAAWVPLTSAEMWRYLAVRIRQGIVQLPELHHYWEATYRDQFIPQPMSRNRFTELHRYFHIVPPVPRGHKQTVVEKTAPFYHQCQRLFQQFFVPGGNFTVDETMIRFQGRSLWITVIKGKPEPIGYKMYTVASDGYLLGFRIFRGKGGYDSAQSVLQQVVVDLVQPWGNANRTLYLDNLCTSPALCNALLQMGIRSCGTCRPNRRGLPPHISEIKRTLPKGRRKMWQRGQLGCLVWHDSKAVIFLSNHLRVDRVTDIPSIHGRPSTTRPTVAVDYNFNKGHVDQVDQLRSYHAVQRRGRRTWPALAWWLLDMCISNAYKLWCVDNSTKPGLLHFREQLLTQIAAAYPSPLTHVQPTAPPVVHQGFYHSLRPYSPASFTMRWTVWTVYCPPGWKGLTAMGGRTLRSRGGGEGEVQRGERFEREDLLEAQAGITEVDLAEN